MRRLLPVLLVAGACDDGPEAPVACTEEFRSWVVVAVDDAGTPAAGLDVEVTRPSTGAVLPYGEPGLTAGSYRVMDDGMSNELRVDGETIVAEGAGEGVSFRAEFSFGTDPWRCHVEKRAGPDTVVVGGVTLQMSAGPSTSVSPSFRSAR